ncbi:MAG: right-handed parallel beta-helix repeat-containing protein [Symploca sp. SIO2G7]|nr:right-handed parallel beta-helix repeat-containing protein [Symploca sp. SIO2G7]
MISKPALSIFLGIFLTGIFPSTLAAQTTEAETAPPATTGSAADLKITPRVGAGYNSSAAGYDGFGRFEGFVPLFQNPGKDLLFLEGRLLLDNGANLGGNILLGYRTFNPELNRSFGGYVGYDNRDTGDSIFNQIGLGLESLGEIWDFRLNGYLSVGDTRQVVASSTFDTGFQLTGTPFFQGNSLALTGERIFQSTTIQEAAMSGLDFELGAKIAEFANGGEVRGYGGVYYYDAAGSPSTVGGKLRVEVRPTDYLNLGLGVQHDDLFGTNILFTVGGTFPGTRPSGYRNKSDEPESVWARMGESVSRTASIVVDQQVELVSFTEQSNVVATNPATGQPWVFVQVAEGGSGNGTFESPFGTVTEGVGVAQSDGNYIVYVRSGAAADTGLITIPALVQLLSAGVLQQVDTQEFGLVSLPFSNSGQLTNFTGTITMEDQSVLSGFNLTSNDGSGIVARNLSLVTIRDSNIASSDEAALLLENTTGTIALTNTTLTGNGAPALVGTNINNITFAGGSLTSTNSITNGITFNGVSGAMDISTIPITITNPQGNGIAATNITGSLNLANAQISGSAAEGILLENSTGAIALSNFQISDTGDSGIAARNINNVTIGDSNIVSIGAAALSLENTTGTVTVTNTNLTGDGVPALVGTNINSATFTGGSLTSTNSESNGITFDGITGVVDIAIPTITITNPQVNGIAATNITGSLNLANAQISGSAAEGILLENSTGAIALSNFQISDTGDSGIAGTNLANVTLQDIRITQAQNRGIILEQVDGTVEIANNIITDTVGVLPANPTADDRPTGQGIALFDVTGTIGITNNQITGTTGFPGNIDTANPDNSYLASGQGIALLNATAGEVNLNIADNTITGNANQGVALANLSGAIAITNNDITNTTGTTGNVDNANPDNSELFTGEGIAFNNDTVQNVNLTIVRNTLSNNTSRGISLVNLLGQVTIDDNDITDTQGEIPFNGVSNAFPVGQGIAFTNDTGEVDLTISNNRILRNRNQGILLTDINGTAQINNNTITDTEGNLAVITDGFAALDFSALTNITAIDDFSNQPALDTMADLIASDLPTGQGIVVASAPDTLNLTINNNDILNNHSQGIALDSLVDGTVTITGNTITGTSGALVNNGSFPTGQGILAIHDSGNLNLTISGVNQVRDNFEDGIAVIVGDPTGTVTGTTANITIDGNTFANNGIDTADSTSNEIRGDGIRIFLEGDVVVNSLNIRNNTITTNQDDGIQISQGDLTLVANNNNDGGTSQLNNATISGNTIENQVQQGINVRSSGGTAELTIENNLSISQNGGEGIAIFANGTAAGTAQIDVDILSNILTNNMASGVFGIANNGGRLCVNLNGNNSNTYILNNGGGGSTLEVENLMNVNNNNTGFVLLLAPFITDNVMDCLP